MRLPFEFIVRISRAAWIRKPTMKWILVMFAFALLLTSNISAVDKLLQSSDLVYIGSFRVPHENVGPSSFDAGGGQATYYPAHDSLFLSGNINSFYVAELNIPTPRTGSLAGMNTATVLQNFSDPTEGRSGNIMAGGACCVANGVKPGGLLVYNNKLIGTSFSYYDPEPYYAVRSHYTSGLNLAANDASGMFELSGLPLTREGTHGASFASGWMAEIPSAYQSALGTTHITGNGSLNKINRTSWGPSAFAANLGQLGITVPLPTTPLFYYTEAHPSIGQWNGGAGTYQTTWNGTGIIRGMAWPAGSRSILYIGLVGTGTFCYGTGAECGDPKSPYKGNHAYPYIYRVWAYDVNDLIAAKNGTKKPWEVVPYATWELASPFGFTSYADMGAGGVAYDPATKRLFIAQPQVDGSFPVVNVYAVNVDTPSAPAPPTNVRVVR
jgi:hypothetical protein